MDDFDLTSREYGFMTCICSMWQMANNRDDWRDIGNVLHGAFLATGLEDYRLLCEIAFDRRSMLNV